LLRLGGMVYASRPLPRIDSFPCRRRCSVLNVSTTIDLGEAAGASGANQGVLEWRAGRGYPVVRHCWVSLCHRRRSAMATSCGSFPERVANLRWWAPQRPAHLRRSVLKTGHGPDHRCEFRRGLGFVVRFGRTIPPGMRRQKILPDAPSNSPTALCITPFTRLRTPPRAGRAHL
jgi:hypothetical protein